MQTEVREGPADLVDLVGLDGLEFQEFQVRLMSHYLQYNSDNGNISIRGFPVVRQGNILFKGEGAVVPPAAVAKSPGLDF